MKLLLIATIALICCNKTIQKADGQIHPDKPLTEDHHTKPLAAEEDVGPFKSANDTPDTYNSIVHNDCQYNNYQIKHFPIMIFTLTVSMIRLAITH
uniref:Putative secreted protein n=1 Tax=Panstrongylus lignarius TaxID=156445 RepID=A0A224Y2Y2_9HEMI